MPLYGYGELGYGDGKYGGGELNDVNLAANAGDTFPDFRETEYDDPEVELLDQLPRYLDDGKDSPNHKFLAPVGDFIDRLDDDLYQIRREMYVTTATKMGSLEELGQLVNVTPREDEELEHFRTRIIAGMHASTSLGTTHDLIVGVSAFLRCPTQALGYDEEPPHTIEISVPRRVLSNKSMDPAEAEDLAEQMVAPEKNIVFIVKGTFSFGSLDDDGNPPSSADDYEHGFVSLNDETSTGGTFSTIIGDE